MTFVIVNGAFGYVRGGELPPGFELVGLFWDDSIYPGYPTEHRVNFMDAWDLPPFCNRDWSDRKVKREKTADDIYMEQREKEIIMRLRSGRRTV